MTAKEGLHTQRNMYNKKEDENCVGEEEEFTTKQLNVIVDRMAFADFTSPSNEWFKGTDYLLRS